jgi:hypothetical protein
LKGDQADYYETLDAFSSIRGSKERRERKERRIGRGSNARSSVVYGLIRTPTCT